jgi:hypothetical protein
MSAAPGTGRPYITDQTIRAYMLAWAPPTAVAELLTQRGTRERVTAWLTRWARAISTETANNSPILNRALRFAGRREVHTWTARYGGNTHVVRWLKAVLDNPTGNPEVFDLGQPDMLRQGFAEAVQPGRRGLGEYSPGTWSEAVTWADARARVWYEAAVYIDTVASELLRAMAEWYAGQLSRGRAAAAENRQAEADAAIQRELDRQEAERQQRAATRPQRMQRAAEKLFSGEGRTAQKLRAKLAELGPDKARFALGLAADAAAAADAAGATEAEADAAAEAALEQAVTLLDVVYPLEAPDYYVGSWPLLPREWQALYLALAWEGDPYAESLPVADPAFYVTTLGRIPTPWQNLFHQASFTAE